MTNFMLSVLLFLGVPGACCLLWVRTYKPGSLRGLLLHTLLFLLLSIAVAAGGVYLMFLTADGSYSASDYGALGFTAVIWLGVFGACCIAALLATVGMYIRWQRTETDAALIQNQDVQQKEV